MDKYKLVSLDSLVNCIGFSIYSDEFKKSIKDLNCHEIDENWEVINIENTFRVSFHYKKDHLERIGVPMGLKYIKDDEPILYYVSFMNLISFKERTPNLELPFKLVSYDKKEVVHQKIGIKPYYKQKIHLSETTYGTQEFFDCNNFRVEVLYDVNDCLFELLFNKITKEERSEIIFKKIINNQKKNINPEFFLEANQLISQIPNFSIICKHNSDFSKQIIYELSSFTENSAEYAKSKNPKAILNLLKKLIKKINIISFEFKGLIGTFERDLIIEYIYKVINSIGLKDINCFDITLNWREW